eukprot:CAMPEP_0116930240 /NCGR_PEP_ID=MMETSP0467-20121206/27079_1 /TAXON_ID=283647 /ORGANISM="Mesodinium pulex, Strain SPMC105" /LENGTH=39 /DNA_ID= /DNA_START= /DNA_END= /DNA_ORIENTATION=
MNEFFEIRSQDMEEVMKAEILDEVFRNMGDGVTEDQIAP